MDTNRPRRVAARVVAAGLAYVAVEVGVHLAARPTPLEVVAWFVGAVYWGGMLGTLVYLHGHPRIPVELPA